MSDVKAVEIRAELRQIKTMADHTANIILNVPEDCRGHHGSFGVEENQTGRAAIRWRGRYKISTGGI